jgi:hypothetical protein
MITRWYRVFASSKRVDLARSEIARSSSIKCLMYRFGVMPSLLARAITAAAFSFPRPLIGSEAFVVPMVHLVATHDASYLSIPAGKQVEMPTKAKRRAEISRDYLALVRRFPLAPIRDETHLKNAVRMIDELSIIDDYYQPACVLMTREP